MEKTLGCEPNADEVPQEVAAGAELRGTPGNTGIAQGPVCMGPSPPAKCASPL
jgi:hypothetical protein